MDYIVHGQKGKFFFVIFESSNISKTKEATPTKIGVHAFDINSYLQITFGRFNKDIWLKNKKGAKFQNWSGYTH